MEPPIRLITRRRNKAARDMRPTSRDNGDGKVSTHVMESGEGKGPFKYQVNPTIFPNEDGTWLDLGPGKTDDDLAAYHEAVKRNEVFGFKNKKRAIKFAYGSWKQGADRKEAMQRFREDYSQEQQP